MRFDDHLAATVARFEAALTDLLPGETGPEARVIAAMRYAALGPGKRLRPFFLIEAGALLGADAAACIRAAAALECVHAYSLVHDDLPCMDDDDLRRGRPTTHRAFDEATAVLAGDALLTYAFELLADPATHPDAAIRADLVLALARAAGARGMVGGQMVDMMGHTGVIPGDQLETRDPEKEPALGPGASPLGRAQGLGRDDSFNCITTMQRMKTGALIRVAFEMGCIIARADADTTAALCGYADDIGLAFQMVDDLLDAEGSADVVGKATGKDAAAGKVNFVTLLGVDETRKRVAALAGSALGHLARFDGRADILRDAIPHITVRKR
jgi:farnesyl diphosphate synthase